MEKKEMIYHLEFGWIVSKKKKESLDKEKLRLQREEVQLFQMIVIYFWIFLFKNFI